jgi:hypothetical protein
MSTPNLSDEQLLQALNAHPILKARMINLLGLVNDTSGDLKRADAAEQRAIEELRQLGNELLQDWAEQQVGQRTADALSTSGIQRRGKKSPSLAQ